MSGNETNALVSVIIPTRGRRNALIKCLESIHNSEYRPIEVLVIDDFSPEVIADYVKSLFPETIVLRNEKRTLLAGSRNAGVRSSNGRYLFFVDDDNVVAKDTIGQLVGGIEATSASVGAPLIFYKSDPERIWYAGSWMSPISAVAVFPLRGSRNPGLTEPYETSLFHDAFMVRRQTFETVGEFDAVHFPIYLSEADYSERLRSEGFRAFVIPKAHVWHDVPILKGYHNLLRHMHMTEYSRAYYVARNRILFVKAYRGVGERMLFLTLFLPVLSLMHLITILGARGYDRIHLVRYYLGGIIAGLSEH